MQSHADGGCPMQSIAASRGKGLIALARARSVAATHHCKRRKLGDFTTLHRAHGLLGPRNALKWSNESKALACSARTARDAGVPRALAPRARGERGARTCRRGGDDRGGQRAERGQSSRCGPELEQCRCTWNPRRRGSSGRHVLRSLGGCWVLRASCLSRGSRQHGESLVRRKAVFALLRVSPLSRG